LLLITDDQDVVLQSFDYMPHVERLLKGRGVVFHNGFVHTPVCCPSRSSILTGRYLHRSLIHNNSVSGGCYSTDWKEKVEPYHTFAVHAQAAGYTTVFMGKYLNQYHSDVPRGWDYWYGLEGNSRYYNYTIVEKTPGQLTPIKRHHNDTYPTDYLPLVLEGISTNLLERELVTDNDDDDDAKPWLMVICWPTAHGPFQPEPQYKDTRSELQAPRTINFNAPQVYQNQKHWLLRQLHVISNTTMEQVDTIYHNRIEALITVDNHVSKLVQQVASNQDRVRRDTTVIYTSDNGFQFGQHRLAIDKRHLYEHDIRVPFVVRTITSTGTDGEPTNRVSNKIVANIDIAPTILDIVKENVVSNHTLQLQLEHAKREMDGLSFWNYLRGYHHQQQQQQQQPQQQLLQQQDQNGVDDDLFSRRRDILISYHGEGFSPCGLAECPPPYNGLWYMPDAWNNTYHCVRTIVTATTMEEEENEETGRDRAQGEIEKENSIYCVFDDDEQFVEYYDLRSNPYQLNNDYSSLERWQVQRYEKRLQELLD
jgi:N-acetylglucosamine-6-sulfatase